MFKKDLSNLGWSEVKRRQVQRLPLVKDWIQLSQMTTGSHVIDVGPGPGVFTREYAITVGDKGKVYAIEKSPEAVEYLRRELDGLSNVEVYLADAEQDLDSILVVPDIVIISDVLHHTDSPGKILQGVYASVSGHSRVLVAEYDPTATGLMGPPLENRVNKESLIDIAEKAGFVIDKTGIQEYEHYYLLLRTRK